jgi:DNA-binding transcriptional LysR family regulator
MTGDYAVSAIAPALARFRQERPELRYTYLCRPLDSLIKDLREGDLDVVIGLSANGSAPDAHRSWTEDVVWLQGNTANLDLSGAVPLVSYGEDCAFHRAAIAALNSAGRDSESVFVGSTIASIVAALAAGMGVTTLPSAHVNWPGITVSNDPLLPKPQDITCGIYLREGGGRALREEIADAIEDALRPARLIANVPKTSYVA